MSFAVQSTHTATIPPPATPASGLASRDFDFTVSPVNGSLAGPLSDAGKAVLDIGLGHGLETHVQSAGPALGADTSTGTISGGFFGPVQSVNEAYRLLQARYPQAS